MPESPYDAKTRISFFSSAFSTFTLFHKLPIELRLKIWKFAQPGPRNVLIVYDSPYSATSKEPPPALLAVNREARQVALKSYRLLFDGSDVQLKIKRLFINPEIDVLIIAATSKQRSTLTLCKRTLSLLSNDVFDHLKQLTVCQTMLDVTDKSDATGGEDNLIHMKRFQALEVVQAMSRGYERELCSSSSCFKLEKNDPRVAKSCVTRDIRNFCEQQSILLQFKGLIAFAGCRACKQSRSI